MQIRLSNQAKIFPVPKKAHILKKMHLQYMTILGHKQYLHLHTNRIQGKQNLTGNQHDKRLIDDEKTCKACHRQVRDEQLHIWRKASHTNGLSHLHGFPIGRHHQGPPPLCSIHLKNEKKPYIALPFTF